MIRRALVLALVALAAAAGPVVAATANPGPLPVPLPVADTLVNEGVTVEGPLINNFGLPTVL
ncbi:hypothetical protein ABZ921_17155 [Streptomyces atriruber]|uniref:Secreted protein n=1 Tax=Streptomyces atriruber TaxID=545121 RepID=A0ABV3BNP3_9ACTN